MFSSEQPGHLHQKVLAAFKESVRRRTVFSEIHLSSSPVVVLFSGGLDSTILAALLDQCLDSKFEIDLLNVSFDGELAPDKIFAMDGVKELRKIAPLRRFLMPMESSRNRCRIVEIDHGDKTCLITYLSFKYIHDTLIC
uniref:Asparagine synthetase domain-containing protein n=1 Tax=Lactuca sativa TaxID=4236 RepID=A0A9R1X2Z0_LACSA|nr:hypothetical protein LSAT_V11C700386240 [Lactuca sativa]